MIHLLCFLSFQSVRSGNRNQLYHFHHFDGGLFHLFTKIGIVPFDLASESDHQAHCNGNGGKEEKKHSKAFKNYDTKCHYNIQHSREYLEQ